MILTSECYSHFTGSTDYGRTDAGSVTHLACGEYTQVKPGRACYRSCLTFYCDPCRPGQRYDQKYCRSWQRETRAMHNLFRRSKKSPGLVSMARAAESGRSRGLPKPITRGLGKNTELAHRDHYKPVSRGGLHSQRQRLLPVGNCNVSKHDNMPPNRPRFSNRRHCRDLRNSLTFWTRALAFHAFGGHRSLKISAMSKDTPGMALVARTSPGR